MSNLVVWALMTAIISGGVWVAIVVLQRQRRLIEEQPILLDAMRRRLSEMESVEKRLAEVEERLEFAERLLTRQRDEARLPPPDGS